ENQEDFEAEINNLIKEKDLSLFLLVVTDIINNNSEVLALGDGKENVEKAFNVKLDHNRALLEGVVSRKKQIVTALTDAYNGYKVRYTNTQGSMISMRVFCTKDQNYTHL